jgi:hypothetical protein
MTELYLLGTAIAVFSQSLLLTAPVTLPLMIMWAGYFLLGPIFFLPPLLSPQEALQG